MESVFLPVLLPEVPFRGLILTSETAAMAARTLPGLPKLAWCVGDRTATAAGQAGFEVYSAKGDANDLFALIRSTGEPGPLLYLHGRETRGTLAQDLISAGTETFSVLAYAQNPCPLTPRARHLIRQPGPLILPMFSPRSATLLVAEWARAGAKATPHLVALSPAVAEAAAPLSPASLTIAAHPDGDSLLEAIRQSLAGVGRA